MFLCEEGHMDEPLNILRKFKMDHTQFLNVLSGKNWVHKNPAQIQDCIWASFHSFER